MRSQQAKLAFSAGEVSPRLALRADLELFEKSLRQGLNLVVTPQGGALYREGCRYVDAPADNLPYRIFQFHRGGDEPDLLIEVSAGEIRQRVDDVLVGEPIPDLYTQAQLEALYWVNQDKEGVLLSPNHPPLFLSLQDDGTVAGEAYDFARIPLAFYFDANSPSAIGGAATYTIDFQNFEYPDQWIATYGGRTAMTDSAEPQPERWTFATDPDNEAQIQQGLRNISGISSAGTAFSAVTTIVPGQTYEITITGANAGREMQFIPTNADSGPIVISVTGIVNSGSEPAWSYPYVVERAGVFYRCRVPHKSDIAEGISSPGTGSDWETYWEDLGTAPPVWWQYQHGGSNDWVTDVNYSPWGRGFPTVGCYHQQRLILFASPQKRTTMWGSTIGDYRDFFAGVLANEAFEFAIDTSDAPAIKWAESQLNLMLGTSSGDWNISAEVALGPGDISAVKQNNARSFGTRPVVVDTEIYYIEQGRTKLRATRYMRDYNGFSSNEVSWLAEHLLRPGIKRVVQMFTPEVVTVMLTGDGQLVVLAHNKAAGSMAWSPWKTNGTVLDLCVYFSTTENEDTLYLVVQRGDKIFLERMRYPARTIDTGQTLLSQGISHLDSWSTGTIAGRRIEGLERLEGQLVSVLADDAWIDGPLLVENGLIRLPEDYNGQDYVVGLAQDMVAQTFEIVSGNQRGVGFGTRRRWNKLVLRLLDSAAPKVLGVLPSDRSPPTPMGTPETVRPGLQDIEVAQAGYRDGSITILQDRPYPTHLLGFYGEYSSENA